MKVSGSINIPATSSRLKGEVDKAQLWLDNEIIADSTTYLPWRTGALEKTAAIPTPGTVEYNAPYARRLYYGEHFNFNKSHHPLSGAYWFERAKAANKNKWVDGVSKIVKG